MQLGLTHLLSYAGKSVQRHSEMNHPRSVCPTVRLQKESRESSRLYNLLEGGILTRQESLCNWLYLNNGSNTMFCDETRSCHSDSASNKPIHLLKCQACLFNIGCFCFPPPFLNRYWTSNRLCIESKGKLIVHVTCSCCAEYGRGEVSTVEMWVSTPHETHWYDWQNVVLEMVTISDLHQGWQLWDLFSWNSHFSFI